MTPTLPALLLLTAGALSAPEAPVDETAVDDLTELQGVWQAVSLQHGESFKSAEEVAELQLAFAGDKLTIQHDHRKGLTMTVRLDRSRSPTGVDLILQHRGIVAARGAFRRVGGLLAIAFVEDHTAERPTEAAVKEGSNTSLIILKRGQSPGAFAAAAESAIRLWLDARK